MSHAYARAQCAMHIQMMAEHHQHHRRQTGGTTLCRGLIHLQADFSFMVPDTAL
jgi:hypothetical protein